MKTRSGLLFFIEFDVYINLLIASY